MRLAARESARSPISLVAMIDVLMIMLVFFMVTSTYLDLDMVPMAENSDAAPAPSVVGHGGGGGRLLVRLDVDGRLRLEGRTLDPEGLVAVIAERAERVPGIEVIVLPSGAADVQALVTVMDAAVAGGARRVRILRLEGSP